MSRLPSAALFFPVLIRPFAALRWVFPVVTCSLCISVSASAVSEKSIHSASAVKGSITFEYSESHTKTLSSKANIEFTSSRSGSVQATLPRYRAYAGVDSFHFKGSAGGQISVSDAMVTHAGGEVARRETGSGNPLQCAITVHFDKERGVYSLAFEALTKTTVTLTGPFQPPSTEDSVAGLSYSSGDLPLPADSTQLIQGEATFTPDIGGGELGSNIVPEGRSLKHGDGAELKPVTVRWSFQAP